VVKQINAFKEWGFSLLEVMIALTLFAFFLTAFLAAQGYNVSDSILNQEQLTLQSLAERKMNELIIDPPKFTNADKNKKETKTFEETEYQGYSYTVELKPLTIPDFAQLFSQKNAVSDEAKDDYQGNYYNDSQKGKRNSSLETMIFEELKKNVERILWQARITVTNKETGYSYSLSTYVTNYNEKVILNVGF
jgi:Tfp pilus assembly protein PilV